MSSGAALGLAASAFAIANALATQVKPLPLGAPKISGSVAPGATLTCSHGAYTSAPTGYTYQWYLNGSPISGATSQTYVPTNSDVNGSNLLTVAETPTNAIGTGAANTSLAVTLSLTPAGYYRTAVGTRNPIPQITANTTATTTAYYQNWRFDRYNPASGSTIKNLTVRIPLTGFDTNMNPIALGGTVKFVASLEVGGTRYTLKQNGSSSLTANPASAYWESDVVVDGNGNPVQWAPGTWVRVRGFVDGSIGNYLFTSTGNTPAPSGGYVLSALSEYMGSGGYNTAYNFTASGDATAANASCFALWIIGDVPNAQKSGLTVDDSKGRGIVEGGSPGNFGDYPVTYSSDSYGNQATWDRWHGSIGMYGINLSRPSSKGYGDGSTNGWAYANITALVSALQGLSFTHFEYGLWQNDQASGVTNAQATTAANLVYGKFSARLQAGAKVYVREVSPYTTDSVAVSATTYSGTTGVDTIPATQAADLAAALATSTAASKTLYIRKAGANQAGFVGSFPVTAVNTATNQVSYTVASGLTTPTTFGTMSSRYSAPSFQTAASYEVNRQARNAAVNALTAITGQTGVFPILAAEQVTRASDGAFIWKTDGLNQSYTAEGIHETATAYAAIVANAAQVFGANGSAY